MVLRADEAPGQAFKQLCHLDFEIEDSVDLAVELVHQDVERLRLWNGAREAVDDEPGAAVGLVEAVADHADHDVGGNVIPPREGPLGLTPQGSSGRAFLARPSAASPGRRCA